MAASSRTKVAAGGAALGLSVLGAAAFAASVRASPTELEPNLSMSVPAIEGPQGTTTYEILPDVNLPSKVEDRIKQVAGRYHKATGKILTVTSGTRDAASQAEAIYDKLAAGDDVVKLYKNKDAALELKAVFDRGKSDKDDKETIVARMAKAIRAQIKRGVFISAHLRSGAADIRNVDMSSAEKQSFVEAAEKSGLRVLAETTPPHFHVQLD
ncbi:MAG: hypothetical protein U0414_29775 [Polyangiaceae bacterium]